jgi:hypothetical protein
MVRFWKSKRESDSTNSNNEVEISDNKDALATTEADPPRQPSVVAQQLKRYEELHEFDPNLPGSCNHPIVSNPL